jgi:hypothetical protein
MNFFYINYLYGGCAGSLLRTALRQSNSLITGKIEGISPILKLSRMTGPAEINGFAGEFPKGKTGNFLS